VCRETNEFAPRIHALLRLAELSGLILNDEQLDFLARFDQYNIAGRYPGTLGPLPSKYETERDIHFAEEVYLWLKTKL
jgi:HEPN domain-containing protein